MTRYQIYLPCTCSWQC